MLSTFVPPLGGTVNPKCIIPSDPLPHPLNPFFLHAILCTNTAKKKGSNIPSLPTHSTSASIPSHLCFSQHNLPKDKSAGALSFRSFRFFFHPGYFLSTLHGPDCRFLFYFISFRPFSRCILFLKELEFDGMEYLFWKSCLLSSGTCGITHALTNML